MVNRKQIKNSVRQAFVCAIITLLSCSDESEKIQIDIRSILESKINNLIIINNKIEA